MKHRFVNDEEERGFRPKLMFALSHDRPTAKALQLPAHMQEAKSNKGREEERLVMLVAAWGAAACDRLATLPGGRGLRLENMHGGEIRKGNP